MTTSTAPQFVTTPATENGDFWPNGEHWSIDIPWDTPHVRAAALAEHGFVQLRDAPFEVPEAEYLGLEYMDWKSGGDTNFAPIATADGELDCRGFWNDGDERPDKDAKFTSNALKCPTIATYVESIGANFGRVRIIKLNPSKDEAEAYRNLHLDDNNRLNPDGEGWVVRTWLQLTDDPNSFMILRENKDDPSTESRVYLPKYSQFVIDSQRLWHAAYHPGPNPRYALITSFESGPVLQRWMESQQVPVGANVAG
jgi:hypothetical protein